MNADEIRSTAFRHFVEPARTRGETTIMINAGELADKLRVRDRMPAICGAIGANKFKDEFGLELLSRTGPQSGRSATFTFKI